jgi:hypothetical protein
MTDNLIDYIIFDVFHYHTLTLYLYNVKLYFSVFLVSFIQVVYTFKYIIYEPCIIVVLNANVN